MSHRKHRRLLLENNTDPDNMAAWMNHYLEWSKLQNYSPSTINLRRSNLSIFLDWCLVRDLNHPGELTKPIIECYQRHLFYYRCGNGKTLGFRRQGSLLLDVKSWLGWLAKHNHILYNPASELDLPRQIQRQLPDVLTPDEVEKIMTQCDLNEFLGVRDRVILETFYSTGMRRQELVNLCVYDVVADQGTVMIRQGKGKKDRMVPIGERALAWIDTYINEVRCRLVTNNQELILFLNCQGQKLAPESVSHLTRGYLKAAGIKKQGSCHLFRHTVATAMLDNGADIRFIQEILGHTSLSTTQMYTHVSIKQLKQIYNATHPAALIDRAKPDQH